VKRRDIALAAMTSTIWGLGFVAIQFGLESFSPPQLAALRFLVPCAAIPFVRRPAISWSMLILIGLTLFTGQFLLLFFAYIAGLPPGLAAVTQQMQVFFTVILSALFLGDVPTIRQSVGMSVAFCGLALIAATTGTDLTVAGLALAMAAAFSWAIGNVLLKRVGPVPMRPLIVWLSLVPPIPALLVSGFDAQSPSLLSAMLHASWASAAAVIYLGVLATPIAYAIWGYLLSRYPAGAIAPFALLAPCAGVAASAVAFGEVFGPVRYLGIGLILAGLVFVVLSRAELRLPVRASDLRPR
jgi:O-acetylserine/cysteine efflux transporter